MDWSKISNINRSTSYQIKKYYSVECLVHKGRGLFIKYYLEFSTINTTLKSGFYIVNLLFDGLYDVRL